MAKHKHRRAAPPKARDTMDPTPERQSKGGLVEAASTRTAGETVWQEHPELPIIDQLLERRYIDPTQHGVLAEYRNDLHLGGSWRSPPSSRYGRVSSDKTPENVDLAQTRVRRLEAHVVTMMGAAGRNLIRNVCFDELNDQGEPLKIPVNGPPYWIAALRRATGHAAVWRENIPQMPVDSRAKGA